MKVVDTYISFHGNSTKNKNMFSNLTTNLTQNFFPSIISRFLFWSYFCKNRFTGSRGWIIYQYIDRYGYF